MCAKQPSTGSSTFPVLVVLAIVLVAAGLTKNRWYPILFPEKPVSLLDKLDLVQQERAEGAHNHGGHAEGSVVALSERGLKNVGYEEFVVKATDYQRQLTLPAIVVERPGRSQVHLSAPLTGVVSKIHSVPGEAVESGQLLFEVLLTHEDIVTAQRDFLRTVENLGVVEREIARLKSLDEGVIAGKRILQQEYEKQKLEASLHAESQAMLLHGLSQEQVDAIRESRKLFQQVEISAPEHTHANSSCQGSHPFQIQELMVAQGQQIEAGSHLAILGDHCELMLEAIAFEDDAPAIRQAIEEAQSVTARCLNNKTAAADESDLQILYVADQIETESRALKVYLRLPNTIALDRRNADGSRYVEWEYKPGQRMQVSIPVETWENQLVLPIESVIDDGAETYVYEQHGDHFDQVMVHVLHRDQSYAVIASDGALKDGDKIAGKGAYQIHLTLKNQAGGGIDPHAGHDH